MPDASIATIPKRSKAGLEREIGSAGSMQSGPFYWSDVEETPELQFPHNLVIYDRMRRTDAQTASIIRAMSLPIRSTVWSLMGSDVRPEVMALVEKELGLAPPDRGRKGRDVSGVNWQEFLRHALLHVPLGFMAFEQVYRVGPPGPGLEEMPGMANREVAHIRKLAPRMPRQIKNIKVARDGGLEAIVQDVRRDDGFGYEEKDIGVESLVMFVNDREGADWAGNAILRSSYKHWLIAEGLERLGPLVAERNGMGLPVVKYPKGGDRNLALAIARSARAGEDAGVAMEDKYSLELLGVSGSLKDELPLLKFHKEQSGKNALTMLLDLGHDAGARALGDTFLAFLLMALDAIAGYVAEVITEHVIRDLVVINFGTEETYPILKAEPIEPKAQATSAAVTELVNAGVVIPDNELEVHERRRYGLPIRPGLPTAPPTAPVGSETDLPVEDEDEDEDDPDDGIVDDPDDVIGDDEIAVKTHKRRKPAGRSSSEALSRRLEVVRRQIDSLRQREERLEQAES